MSLRLRCPAKVNLHLEVLGRRPDGYHELRTLFAAIGVWDELTLAPEASGILRLQVEPRGVVPEDGENLVLRAAALLRPRAPAGAGVAIDLRKRIPVGAGLGGGSADAACALVGIARLWGLEPEGQELDEAAAALGSDVPFFLLGGAAWGRGRGTELTPLPDLPSWWTVLLPGSEAIPTAAVYGRLASPPVDADASSEVYDPVVRSRVPPLHEWRNDLEPFVLEGWPEVGRRLAALRGTAPMLAQVSGSGGTVFGLYGDEVTARRAAAALAAWGPVIAPVLRRAESGPVAWEV